MKSSGISNLNSKPQHYPIHDQSTPFREKGARTVRRRRPLALTELAERRVQIARDNIDLLRRVVVRSLAHLTVTSRALQEAQGPREEETPARHACQGTPQRIKVIPVRVPVNKGAPLIRALAAVRSPTKSTNKKQRSRKKLQAPASNDNGCVSPRMNLALRRREYDRITQQNRAIKKRLQELSSKPAFYSSEQWQKEDASRRKLLQQMSHYVTQQLPPVDTARKTGKAQTKRRPKRQSTTSKHSAYDAAPFKLTLPRPIGVVQVHVALPVDSNTEGKASSRRAQTERKSNAERTSSRTNRSKKSKKQARRVARRTTSTDKQGTRKSKRAAMTDALVPPEADEEAPTDEQATVNGTPTAGVAPPAGVAPAAGVAPTAVDPVPTTGTESANTSEKKTELKQQDESQKGNQLQEGGLSSPQEDNQLQEGGLSGLQEGSQPQEGSVSGSQDTQQTSSFAAVAGLVVAAKKSTEAAREVGDKSPPEGSQTPTEQPKPSLAALVAVSAFAGKTNQAAASAEASDGETYSDDGETYSDEEFE